MTEQEAMEYISKLLSTIEDRSIQNILRRIIFDGIADWQEVIYIIKQEHPEVG